MVRFEWSLENNFFNQSTQKKSGLLTTHSIFGFQPRISVARFFQNVIILVKIIKNFKKVSYNKFVTKTVTI